MRWLLAPLVLLLAVASAPAQEAYPSRPVRVIVGLAAGSSTDVTARIIGQKMGQALGQSFIVENRPGAGGNIATGFVAHNPPDGYTLLFGSASVTVNATLMPNAGFDLVKDLTPIVLLAGVPNILVVHPSLGVKTVDDLIAKAKSKPGEIAYASSGIGTSPHLSAELFSMMASVKLVHVPYKGSSQAMTDLMAGQTAMMFVQPHRAGLDAAQAHQHRARSADHGRGGVERFRHRRVVRSVRAGGDAERDRRQVGAGRQCGDRGRGRARRLRAAGHRHHWRDAGAVFGLREIRNRQVGESHRDGGRQAAINFSRSIAGSRRNETWHKRMA